MLTFLQVILGIASLVCFILVIIQMLVWTGLVVLGLIVGVANAAMPNG